MNDLMHTTKIIDGLLSKEIEDAYISADKENVCHRLFQKDPYLWTTDPAQTNMISESMGWLTLPDDYMQVADNLIAFSLGIKNEGYKYAVLIGMGGSSLCTKVARDTFGTTDNFLEMHMLDNTGTSAILEIEKHINIEKTLFIVATKSGSTKETLSFFKYFYNQLKIKGKGQTGNNFIAITDHGSPLVAIAEEHQFRKVFLNPTDIGGRYSVLSDFGLLPMALMGVDIKAIMAAARLMKVNCSTGGISVANNPGISLGLTLGICQRHGLDKITFVPSSSINSFGYWAEQLLAESTGKEGKGLIPVDREELGNPDVYSMDRVFVQMYLSSDDNLSDNIKLEALEAKGHPVIRIHVKNKLALGGENYRWEVAAAIAGMVMGINPFNQPNVEESKKNTNNLLDEFNKEGKFSIVGTKININDFTIYRSKAVKLPENKIINSISVFFSLFYALAQPHDYIAFLPYFMLTDSRTKAMQAWRMQTRDMLKTATTLLNGPRYLHSTGQLHKGGPDTGLYIILVGDEEIDLPIPGEKFGFATLHKAQSLGDFRSLDDKGRRVVYINLGKDIDKGLKNLLPLLKKTDTNQNV